MSADNATCSVRVPGCDIEDGDIAFMTMATTFVMLQTPALGLAQAGSWLRRMHDAGVVFLLLLLFQSSCSTRPPARPPTPLAAAK